MNGVFIQNALNEDDKDVVFSRYYSNGDLTDFDICMGTLLPQRTYTYRAFSFCSLTAYTDPPIGCYEDPSCTSSPLGSSLKRLGSEFKQI